MPPSLTTPASALPRVMTDLPEAWRAPLARFACLWLALIVLMRDDWREMADKWWSVSTYNHVIFVPPIVGWLVWQRRKALSGLLPRAWAPGLPVLGVASFCWLLGTVSGVNSASQLGAVFALQAAALLMLGPRVALSCAFPLAFMLFLVPFGDELMPLLQMVTAKMVIAMTHWSGIPAVIDGVFIDTPVGLFEVAEACSGVKFLVAMLALGTLVGYCCFRSWPRRMAFLASAIGLSILANGVRAWGTIYIAQWQGIEFAAGFDHVFYGWVFFALVIAILLAAFWRWFDRDPESLAELDFADVSGGPFVRALVGVEMGRNRALGAGLLVGVCALVWSAMALQARAPVPPMIALPQVPGWQQVAFQPDVPWHPRAQGSEHRLLGRYRDSSGRTVDVFFAYYARQVEGSEASAYGEGAFDPQTEWRWLSPAVAPAEATGEVLLARGRVKRVAQTSYRTGNLTTGSAARLKLATMATQVMLRPRPTLLLILSVEERPGEDGTAVIAAFRRSIGDQGGWMDRVAGLP